MLGIWCGKETYSSPHSVMNTHSKMKSTFTKQTIQECTYLTLCVLLWLTKQGSCILTCEHLYLLTYFMVQIPSWEADWFAASQEIPRILWNPKVHYRAHKRPPLVPILGQPNPVRIPTSHLLEIHPNIIHPSMPRSPQRSPSLRFPHQDPIHPPLLTHTRHMPSP